MAEDAPILGAYRVRKGVQTTVAGQGELAGQRKKKVQVPPSSVQLHRDVHACVLDFGFRCFGKQVSPDLKPKGVLPLRKFAYFDAVRRQHGGNEASEGCSLYAKMNALAPGFVCLTPVLT